MELTTIIALIKNEMQNIDNTVRLCLNRKERRNECIALNLEDVLIDSIAACMHSFYTGLEKLFKLITEEIDGGLPKSERWHAKLLDMMMLTLPVRCPVISKDTKAKLDQFRQFRHLFQNIYTHNVIPERVIVLCDTLSEIWLSTQSDIDQFIQQMGESDDNIQGKL